MNEEERNALMELIVHTAARLFEGNELSEDLKEILKGTFETVLLERAERDLREVECQDKPDSVEALVSALVSRWMTASCDHNDQGGHDKVKPVISELSDNICVLSDSSSSDNQSSEPLEPPLKCPKRSHRQSEERQQSKVNIESKVGPGGAPGDIEDDIIEIVIDDNDVDDAEDGDDEHQSKENIDYSQKNSRKRPNSHQIHNNQTQNQHKYDFRQRRNRPEYFTRSTSNSTVSNGNSVASDNHKTSNSRPATAEVIQIEDSSDDNNGDSDDDVQEIGRETRPGFTNFTGFTTFATFTATGTSNGPGMGRSNSTHNNNNNNNFRRSNGFKGPTINPSAPPTEADPSQLASIPMVVTFPTMRAASFNGHLYISHNHKFSVKLQGIDPRSFQWNDSR